MHLYKLFILLLIFFGYGQTRTNEDYDPLVKPMIYSICNGTVAYLFNKLFTSYEKRNPNSYAPPIGRFFFVHPTKVSLVITGLAAIGFTYAFDKILNRVGLRTDTMNKKNETRIKLKNYSFGAAHIFLGLLLTYVCYKEI